MLRKLRILFILTIVLAALVAGSGVFAADNQGTEFWLAFPAERGGRR